MEGENKQGGCSGRCENCNVNQRIYCCAQMAYYAQQEIAEIKAFLATFSQKKEDDSIVVLREEDKVVEEEIINVSEGI